MLVKIPIIGKEEITVVDLGENTEQSVIKAITQSIKLSFAVARSKAKDRQQQKTDKFKKVYGG